MTTMGNSKTCPLTPEEADYVLALAKPFVIKGPEEDGGNVEDLHIEKKDSVVTLSSFVGFDVELPLAKINVAECDLKFEGLKNGERLYVSAIP